MSRGIRIAAAPIALGRSSIRAVCVVLALAATPGSTSAADKLVLQLHREPQFEFAGYYAALWKGFYREAGLDVEIKSGAPPGGTPIDPVREVIERRARFGTGTAQLLIRAAQGLPLLMLAPIFQQSGAAVYYRADGDFSSPRALLNARVGRLPASNILDIELRTVLHSEAIDPDKLKSVSIEPGQAVAALADRRIDAVVGSAWELPWQARERAVAVKSFAFPGNRPEFYGDGLFTLQRFANADPLSARRFREASIKGWEYALQHPDEIGARLLAELPVAVPVSDPAGFARYQGEVARKLAGFPAFPLGQSNPERWSGIQQSLIGIGATSRPVDLETFLYDPDGEARGLTAWWALLILAATAAIGFLVAAGLLWRRRHRPGAAPQSATNFLEVRKLTATLLDQMRPHTLIRLRLTRLRATALDGLDGVQKIARQLAASISGPFWRGRRLPGAAPASASISAEFRKRIAAQLDPIRRHTMMPPNLAWLHAMPLEGVNRARKVVRELAASTSGLSWLRRQKPGAAAARTSYSAEFRKRIAALVDRVRQPTLVRSDLARLRATALEGFDQVRKITRQLGLPSTDARPGVRPTDLNATLTALDRSIGRRLPNTVKCRLSLLPEPWLCQADPDTLSAVILDLVTEAVADMQAGGELVVGTRHSTIDHAAAGEFPGSAPGEYVRLTVKDSGSGLSPEHLDRVFFPETTARPAIAASWELTRWLGGFATVESAEGIGTAVHLYFIRARATGESAGEPVEDEMQAQAAE